MRQGDSYPLYITDSGLDLSRIVKIEFTIGPYVKSYPGTVTYDSTTGVFTVPLSQLETMPLVGKQICQARIKYNNNEVEGITVGSFDVAPSMSKEVI